MNQENFVQKIWNLCNILRGDGISYHEYISELTYLLFLKIAKENESENLLPEDYRWDRVSKYDGEDLLTEYRDVLTFLGGHASNEIVRRIYAFPTTVFSNKENLKAVIDGIDKLDWHSLGKDSMGDIYEGLLSKNSQDSRSGAGQYFTPRSLVDCIVRVVKPKIGEIIQDPATGTGGFLISADHYIRQKTSSYDYERMPPVYEGVEIEKSTYRICLMNAFLHGLKSNIILGDALTTDAAPLAPADLILANPPFGVKTGSVRKMRAEITNSNKQLAFLQHIYSSLKVGGRAAVVVPDNVLFDEGIGKRIREELMSQCNLHTILRLPTGIFYSPGVKTNVLFFVRRSEALENTSGIWFYDMRSDISRYNRGNPLREIDFEDFENCFGPDENGESVRVPTDRWRLITRNEILKRDGNLDVNWSQSADTENELSGEDPFEIAIAIQNIMREALATMSTLSEELGNENKVSE